MEGYLGRVSRFFTFNFRNINPIEKEIYLHGLRRLGDYYRMKEINDRQYNSLKLELPQTKETEQIILRHGELKIVDDLLKIYRQIEKTDPKDKKLKELRTMILDEIDTL